MKKSILILSGGIVVISILLLVNEKWIKKTSAPTTADNQQETESVQQGSPPAQKKTTPKPTSKLPVYDLSNKAHWYDPKTTIGKLYGSSKLLSELLKPFHPKLQEFQHIAQYEASFKKLKESLSEDEYYSVEGRLRLIEETEKLNDQLLGQLGKDRFLFYAEVRKLETGYYNTWKALTINGISETRVPKFRELAEEFNQQMHDRSLYRGDTRIVSPAPGDSFHISFEERDQIAKRFRERIEKEFGKQVLDDILFLDGVLVYMQDLTRGMNPTRMVNLIYDPKYQDRLKDLYGVEFISEEEGNKDIEESRRLEERESALLAEMLKHGIVDRTVSKEPLILIPGAGRTVF